MLLLKVNGVQHGFGGGSFRYSNLLKTFFLFVEAKNETIVQKDATYQRVNMPFNRQLDANQKLIKYELTQSP